MHAVLSDANEELVICFEEVRRDPHALMELLDAMPNTREFYHQVRKQDPAKLTLSERAARVIYLNKTSFRGLWRVNRQGEYNVPYGEYSRPYYNREALLRASKVLAVADVEHTDFADAFRRAREGDWIYADPPYVPETEWGDFKRYTPDQFHDEDHERLAELMREATERGVYVMVTNSDMPPVRRIFASFAIGPLATRRDIHLDSTKRKSKDLVITNYVEFRAERLPLDDVRPRRGLIGSS